MKIAATTLQNRNQEEEDRARTLCNFHYKSFSLWVFRLSFSFFVALIFILFVIFCVFICVFICVLYIFIWKTGYDLWDCHSHCAIHIFHVQCTKDKSCIFIKNSRNSSFALTAQFLFSASQAADCAQSYMEHNILHSIRWTIFILIIWKKWCSACIGRKNTVQHCIL